MTYDVWTGDGYTMLPAAESGGEVVMTPNINGYVLNADDEGLLLLQRRDKPDEAVRGRLELPGGRWRAGETAVEAISREVYEETGIAVVDVKGVSEVYRPSPEVSVAMPEPLSVVAGQGGAYPSLHIVFECRGRGEPTDLIGETADVTWWDVTEVEALLETEPAAFVWHTVAMLRSAWR